MEIKTETYVEKLSITINQEEAQLLKDLILFAFDYDGLKPNSLYTREKILGKKLIEELDNLESKKVIEIDINEELGKEKNE